MGTCPAGVQQTNKQTSKQDKYMHAAELHLGYGDLFNCLSNKEVNLHTIQCGLQTGFLRKYTINQYRPPPQHKTIQNIYYVDMNFRIEKLVNILENMCECGPFPAKYGLQMDLGNCLTGII